MQYMGLVRIPLGGHVGVGEKKKQSQANISTINHKNYVNGILFH